jgi:Fe2+ transport system protein B
MNPKSQIRSLIKKTVRTLDTSIQKIIINKILSLFYAAVVLVIVFKWTARISHELALSMNYLIYEIDEVRAVSTLD